MLKSPVESTSLNTTSEHFSMGLLILSGKKFAKANELLGSPYVFVSSFLIKNLK